MCVNMCGICFSISFLLLLCLVKGIFIKTELSATQSTQYSDYCICMPYWQCKEDFSGLNDDIASVVDIRMLKPTNNQTPDERCNDFDVCCQVGCGRRRRSNYLKNKFGLGTRTRTFRLTPFASTLTKRILGENNEAEFGEFPWMLGILLNNAFLCGASLIHPQVAMTAAHCVVGKSGVFIVRAGEWDWESFDEAQPHQDRSIKEVVVHPLFQQMSVRYDIALLVMNEAFELGENVGVVCLPPPNVRYDGSMCTASGWGKNAYHEGKYQSVLKKTDLPLVDRGVCTKTLQEARLGPLFRLHRSFICAGGIENEDTCKGDGGSPLICPVNEDNDIYEQVGIVSWGLTCGLKNTPGVYVNVPLFSKWIDKMMEKLNFDTRIYKYKAER